MGVVRKIGDEYFIEFYARGLKYQQKIGPDQERAQAALKDIEAQIANGEAATFVRDVDLDIFFNDFLESMRGEHTAKTILRYEATVKNFGEYLQRECPSIKKLSEVTHRVIEDYKAHTLQYPRFSLRRNGQINPKVINLTLILLRDVFQYAIKLGYISDNPTLHTKYASEGSWDGISCWAQEEIQRFLNVCPSEIKSIVEMMFLTGLNLREMITLSWNQVDWEESFLNIPSVHVPKKLRRIPLSNRAQEILKSVYRPQEREGIVFKDSVKKSWGYEYLKKEIEHCLQKMKEAAGHKRNLSSIRHSFAIALIQKGMALSVLYRMMGKKDIAELMLYSRYFKSYSLDE